VTRHSVERLLAIARANITRLSPHDAAAAVACGALLIDLRPLEYRWRYGEILGATAVSRHVLEWRLDPASEHRLAALPAGGYDHPIVLMCNEGYASSLAAYTLRQDLGLSRLADLRGGFAAWVAAGLPYRRRVARPDSTPSYGHAAPIGRAS
jgi:rhodanese-related sulfurtransferase